MVRSRIVSMALAGAVVLGACTTEFDREQAQDRPSPSTAASEAPAPSGGDRSSLNGRIAFDNFDDVWTIDADGTDLIRLTHSPGPDFDPSWSPDGTQIAFRSERSGEPEIWVVKADGSGQRRLVAGLSPAWAPDGSHIVVSAPGLFIMDPDGSRVIALQTPGIGETSLPDWTDWGRSPRSKVP